MNKVLKKGTTLLTLFALFFGVLSLGLSTKISAKSNGLGSVIPEKILVNVGTDETNVGIAFQTNNTVPEAKVVISTQESLASAREIEATSKIVVTNDGNDTYTAWGAYVTDLIPDTNYYYKVGSDLGWSNVLTFKTIQTEGDMTILFYGDIQGGYTNLPNVMAEARALYPEVDLTLLAGDVSDNARNYSDWTSFDTHSKQYLNEGIWAAAIGNHDVYEGGHTFTSYFYGPDNGIKNDAGARNYYFEFNDAVIFNFDTEAGFASYDPGYTKQIKLLRQVMTETTKKYKIVLMHRSVYPLFYNDPSITALAPVFEELGIDLILSGHDHVYGRTTMMSGAKTKLNSGGITYVIGGCSSGSKYYDEVKGRPWSDVVYDDNNPVFTALEFIDGEISVKAYALDGGRVRNVDRFKISKLDVELTKTEGVDVEGYFYAKPGESNTYNVEVEDGYILDYVKVDGQEIELVNNKFTLENITANATIEVKTIKVDKPIAKDIEIVGNLITGNTITVDYDYYDPNNNEEKNTVVSWFIDGNKVFEGLNFEIKTEHLDKQIEVRVTATSDVEVGFERGFISSSKVKLFGDLDGDMKVTNNDALLLLQAITGKIELSEEQVLLAGIGEKPTLADVRKILESVEGK